MVALPDNNSAQSFVARTWLVLQLMAVCSFPGSDTQALYSCVQGRKAVWGPYAPA